MRLTQPATPLLVAVALAMTPACRGGAHVAGDGSAPADAVGDRLPARHYAELALAAGSLEAPALGQARAIASCFNDSDPNDTAMYLCIGDGHRIMQLTRESGAVRVIAGSNDNVTAKDGTGAAAGFGAITDLASDHRGLLYVVDGCLIRKVVIATGAVTTLDSYPTFTCGGQDGVVNPMMTGPSHLYYCPINNSVFVADGALLRRIDAATDEVTIVTPPTDPFGASGVGSVTCDGNHLLVANGTIIEDGRLDDQGLASWLAESVLPMPTPDLTSISAQIDHLYLLQGSTIWSYTYDSMVTERCFPPPTPDKAAPSPSFGCPVELAAGPARDLYITDPCTHSVRSIDCDQHAVTTLVAGAPLAAVDEPDATKARFAWPTGLATDDAGDVFIVDVSSVRKLSAAHEVSTVAAGALPPAPNRDWPIGVASDGAHTLYVADAVGNTIQKIATDTGAVSALVPPVLDGKTQLPQPTGLALDRKAGKLYVGDPLDHTLRSVDTTTGQVTLVAGQPYEAGSADGDATASTWVYPVGLAFDGQRLLVADAGALTIRAVDVAAKTVKTLAGAAGLPGTARGSGKMTRFLEPVALALDQGGNLFVVDWLAGTVCAIDLSTGDVATVATILGTAPPDRTPTGAHGTAPGPLPSTLYLPQGLTFGPANELLLSVPNAVVVAR